jgi:acetylornithine deacetylase
MPSKPSATLELLARLVAFDTTSRNSNLPLIDWVDAYLAQHGVIAERFSDTTGSKAALWASIGPADKGGYVLSGHTDVVPVDGQDWTRDPFTLRVENGLAYGRGATDMKGFLACCLAAVPQMCAQPLKTPIHLAFSYDEEIGCVGVRPMLEAISLRSPTPLGAFIGEPTQMQVVTGHKGKRSIKARIRGFAAHSSLAPQAVNAVEFGALLVAKIREIGARLQKTGATDSLYDVAHSTGHVGIFHGGSALNIVPHEAEIVFEFRTIGADDPDALVAEVIDYARTVLEPQMQVAHPECGIDFEVYAGFPGLDTAADAPIATLARQISGRNNHAKVAYGTEAGLFTQIAGIPAIIIGPGSIQEAHKPDEFVALSELAACDAFISGLIAHCRKV